MMDLLVCQWKFLSDISASYIDISYNVFFNVLGDGLRDAMDPRLRK